MLFSVGVAALACLSSFVNANDGPISRELRRRAGEFVAKPDVLRITVVKNISVSFTVDTLTTNMASGSFVIQNPDQFSVGVSYLSVKTGINNITYAVFNKTFNPPLILPAAGLLPYGPINDIYLPLGAANSLDILSGSTVDLQEANLTVIAFNCIPIPLRDIQQLAIPAEFALDTGAAAALKQAGKKVSRDVPVVDVAKRDAAAYAGMSELELRDAAAMDKRAAAAAMQPYYTILLKGLVKSINVIIGLDSLTTNQANGSFVATNPVGFPLEVRSVSANVGVDGKVYATFKKSFTKFTLPALGSANSGNFTGINLPMGATNSLDILGRNVDIYETNITVRAFGCIPIVLTRIRQFNIPTTYDLDLPTAAALKKAAAQKASS